MSRKRYCALRRRNPEFGLPAWGQLVHYAQRMVRESSPETILSMTAAQTLASERLWWDRWYFSAEDFRQISFDGARSPLL